MQFKTKGMPNQIYQLIYVNSLLHLVNGNATFISIMVQLMVDGIMVARCSLFVVRKIS